MIILYICKFITLIDGVIIYYPQYVLKIKRFVNQYTNEKSNKDKYNKFLILAGAAKTLVNKIANLILNNEKVNPEL
ncbi:hypothetical protein [Lebetimonas sp. JH292]|uniref:hypothetical protein n=1 Tax=Lebetimonas sp. JH292 TaxID=990068 RepID=UPI000467B293|nr:hypothetical protein [Lebetimonas sp. JH292]